MSETKGSGAGITLAISNSNNQLVSRSLSDRGASDSSCGDGASMSSHLTFGTIPVSYMTVIRQRKSRLEPL